MEMFLKCVFFKLFSKVHKSHMTDIILLIDHFKHPSFINENICKLSNAAKRLLREGKAFSLKERGIWDPGQ